MEWMILLDGSNDICGIRPAGQFDDVVLDLTNAYREMVEKIINKI